MLLLAFIVISCGDISLFSSRRILFLKIYNAELFNVITDSMYVICVMSNLLEGTLII